MSRKWHLEDWRKIYTRMTASWLSLPWCARGLASDLIRYAQPDGTIADCKGEEPGVVLARLLCAHPGEAKFITKGATALLEDGYLVLVGTKLVVKHHAEAQEKLSPEARRKRRQRDKEQDEERDMSRDMSVTNGVTFQTPVTGHSAGVESSRVESSKKNTPRAPTRIGCEEAWLAASGNRAGNPGDCLTLRRHVDQCAEDSGRDADELFTAAVAEFGAYRETCTAPHIPQFSPVNVLKHWATVWERLTGTAPIGRVREPEAPTPAAHRPLAIPQRPAS
jgi:hypothetical protein